ncbi:MAG: CHRD domain-containing protein [Acidobacteria bacterium]|nr:CHRD domain-containing protein [Acidobacteriota bacterium]
MCKIARVLLLVFATAAFSWAARVDTVALTTTLSPANEVPPVTGVNAGGSCLVLVHVTRNDSGAIAGGVVDFDVNFSFAGAVDFIGLHIHEGPAGQKAEVVIRTDLSDTKRFSHPGGDNSIHKQVVVTDAALLGRLLANPSRFYCNMDTPANPDGVMRGQLSQPDAIFMRTALLPNNEVPPNAGLDAGGSCTIRALVDRNASGQVTGGTVFFDVNYRFADTVDLTGLHIHNGPAGVIAGVVIGTDLNSTTNAIRGVKQGTIFKAVPIRTQVQLDNLRGLLVNPAVFYCNLHTTVNPGGAIRGQMLYAGSTSRSADMVTANEVPPVTGVNGTATGKLSVYYTRSGAGLISGAAVAFDVNYQGFPADTQFTGLHIRNNVAGANGDIVIDSGLSAVDGFTGSAGNIYRLVNVDANNAAALKALNDLLANPARFYINMQTAANPDGAIRDQLGTALTVPPAINQGGIISAVNDATIGASLGALVTLYGTNLVQTTSDLGGLEFPLLPIILNGTDVRVGLRQAPLVYVSPTQINFQIPYETDPGNAQVLVTRAETFSAPVSINVRATAPGIFVNSLGAAVLKNSDFTQVSATNPAAAGDVVSIFSTGLGRVTPPIASGRFAPTVTTGTVPLTVAQPTVTIGGVSAEVLASSLAPGFAGLYQVAVRVPSGVASGNQPVVITADGQRSNAAMMAVK